MSAGLARLRREWEAWARRDPLWAILTEETKQGSRWQADEFFATGEAEAEAFLQHAQLLLPGLRRGRALDFGCGIGRVTRALARRFQETWGVDIAPAMIEAAESFNDQPERCHYAVNASTRLSAFEAGRFDLVYSNITLQHMAPRLARAYVAEFVRVAAPGGLIAFQLPSHRLAEPLPPRGWPRLKRRLRDQAPEALLRCYDTLKDRWSGRLRMEGHGVPKSEVLGWLKRYGARVLEVQHDGSAGPSWVSFRYFATR